MASTRSSRRVNAPRANVHRALLDPCAVATWKVPTGMTSHVHAFDAREGALRGEMTITTTLADAVRRLPALLRAVGVQLQCVRSYGDVEASTPARTRSRPRDGSARTERRS
jgi:hypothetical protein